MKRITDVLKAAIGTVKMFWCIALTYILVGGVSILIGFLAGYQGAKQHYEPLLSDCEKYQAEWEIKYKEQKEFEGILETLIFKLGIEKGKRQTQSLWNEKAIIYPDEGD